MNNYFMSVNAKMDYPFESFHYHNSPNSITPDRTTLYVGNLNEFLVDQQLYNVFSSISSEVYCSIQRDYLGRSRGFAFVTYDRKECAEEALRKLNGFLLMGKPLYINWKVDDIDKIRNERANVYIKNLPFSMTDADLIELAERIGRTISVRISRREDGTSKGQGYVQFLEEAAASDFIYWANSNVVDGTVLYAEHYRPKRPSYIPRRINNENAINFDQIAPQNVRPEPIRISTTNFNYEKLLQDLSNIPLSSRVRAPRYSLRENHNLQAGKCPYTSGSTITVRNLDPSITAVKLKAIFYHSGIIKNVEVDRSLGLARITFNLHSEAHSAMELNGSLICGRRLNISFDVPETRPTRCRFSYPGFALRNY